MEKNKGSSNTVAQKRPRHSPKKGVDECKGCDSKLQEDDFALLCDSCESWVCIVCLEMTEPEYNLFTKMTRRLGSLWFCPVCKQKKNTINQGLTSAEIKDILRGEIQTSFKAMEDKFCALLEPIQRKVAEIENDLKNKCTLSDVQYFTENLIGVKCQSLEKSLTEKFVKKDEEISVSSSNLSSFYVSDIVEKHKNLIVFGLAEDATLSSRRQQNETDCKFFNDKLLVLCPAKCSYSVRLGKHTPGKIRPIKLMFKTPVERDTACFFLMSETASIKATYPLFKVSHDRTTIELLENKKYDALKQELK